MRLRRFGALAALPRLSAAGRSIVVTRGSASVVVRPDGGELRWIAPKAVEVISAHGVDDCFVGALASRLAPGLALIETAELASETAAAFVSRPFELASHSAD